PGDIHTLGGDVLQGSSVATSSFTVVPGRPKILGGLDRELVRRVVRRYVPQLRSCAQKLLQAQPGASPSAMMLKLNIDPTGKVVAAMPSRSSGFGALDRCVLKRAESWRFPAPKSAGITQVELPLAFKARMVSRGGRSDWTLTRLHARYDAKSLGQDLIFTQAKPIVGGRGMPTGKRGRMDEQGARQGSINNFQGRYIILNPWRGKVACQNPMRGIWGGPPNGQGNSTHTARNNAFAPRGRLKLPRFVVRDGPASTLPPPPR
ncbi:MAG: TonB family protein, partial [Myxococcota bacterium]